MTSERVRSRPQQLLERNRELAEIDTCIAAAAAERGSVLVLDGRSGMGKSALLTEVRRRAARAGFAISSARGSELEDEFAFGVVRQLFEPAIGALSEQERARIFEGAAALAQPVLDLGGEPAVGGQFVALHGLYWLAANMSVRGPLLLAVDDAQWADTASLRWLAYLLNRLDGLAMLVAIATRRPPSGPEGEVLAAILTYPQTQILSIGPLGESSVAALIRTTLGREPDPLFTAACLRTTAGNPLALNELLRELRAGGAAPTSLAAGDVDKRAPDSIARRVLRDLSLLGVDAERLARALAVIGDGTELRLVARLADLELDRAAEAADDLRAADILASERPPRFAHPLLRAAVYDRLPAATHQRLHRQASEVLASEAAQPEAVAAHLLRCEAGGSAETIEWLRAAAPLALRRGAPEAALSYLRRALAESAGAETRTAVLAELGKTELAAGDPGAVGHLTEALTGISDPRVRAGVLSDLSLAVILETDDSAGRAVLAEALDELRDYDSVASTRFECILVALAASDPRTASSLDSDYPRLRELVEAGGPNAQYARMTLALLLAHRDGNRQEALSLIGSGFDQKGLFHGRDMDPYGVLWSMLTLVGVDELLRAASWCDTVMREAGANGNLFALQTGLVVKPYAESRLGLLAEAEADATTALAMSEEHFPYWLPLISAFFAEILFERGRHQAAYDAIEGISPNPGSAVFEATFLEVRGRLRCARGWRELGQEDLRAGGRLCEALGMRNPIMFPWRVSLAIALAEDRIEEARELAQANLANAVRSGIPRAIGIADRTLARLDHGNSIELLRRAVSTLEAAPGPLDLARALTELGSTLRRKGYRFEAREPLREALEIAARCGAVPLMNWAQAEAMAAGARPRRPRLRGVDALTPSELRVARLAAGGRSNREIAQALFITIKTVADHLGSTYSKLGIKSREQLSTALSLSTP